VAAVVALPWAAATEANIITITAATPNTSKTFFMNYLPL
jgi:hypothetical protein